MPCGYGDELRKWKFKKRALEGESDVAYRKSRAAFELKVCGICSTEVRLSYYCRQAQNRAGNPSRPTENRNRHVPFGRARIRAGVQRLRNNDRGIRRREKIRRQIYFSANDGRRARLSEPEKN